VTAARNVVPDRDLKLQGHYAGICSRFAGFVIDVAAIVLLYDLIGSAVQFLVSTLSGHQFRINELPVLPWLLFALWVVLYCVYPVAAGGRTLGMAIVGLRVVRADGAHANAKQALVRLLALPLSFVLLGFGFWLILLRRDNRALHDRIGGTAVVYNWDARAARLRFLANQGD